MSRLYTEMTPAEQLQWVQQYAEAVSALKPAIEAAASRRNAPNPAPKPDPKQVLRLMQLIDAWPFAQDFSQQALRYGDYMNRLYRLPVYIDKVNEALADGLTMTDTDGQLVAYIRPNTPLRRRGRPTLEEARLRRMGVQVEPPNRETDETRTRRQIAQMLGLRVITAGEPPRELNNDELRAVREERQRRDAEMNPTLFEVPKAADGPDAQQKTGSGLPQPDDPNLDNLRVQDMGNLSEQLPALQQVKWLLTPDTARAVDEVADLRNLRAAESERAKTMADLHAPAGQIEPHARAAAEANQRLTEIFGQIDRELAEVCYRLRNDPRYVPALKERFRTADADLLIKVTAPYLRKVSAEDPAFQTAVQRDIDRENPEAKAERDRQTALRHEAAEIVRYLKRRDKDASDARLQTATQRYERLRQIAPPDTVEELRPVMEYIRTENLKWREAKAAKREAKAAKRARG